jgi:HSP20 family molecular chaperone IbpA
MSTTCDAVVREKNETPERVTLRPRVDILEEDGHFSLLADLPGVQFDQVNLEFDQGQLRLRADGLLPAPGNGRPDRRPVRYEHQFQLGQQIDTENIAADLRHGVLAVRLPKRVHAQPRRIPVAPIN